MDIQRPRPLSRQWEENFDRERKQMIRVVWVIVAASMLAMAVLVYVAVHFLLKIW